MWLARLVALRAFQEIVVVVHDLLSADPVRYSLRRTTGVRPRRERGRSAEARSTGHLLPALRKHLLGSDQ